MKKQFRTEIGLTALLSVFLLQGCVGGGSGETNTDNTDTQAVADSDTSYQAIFTAVADEVFIPSYQSFADQTESWSSTENAVSAYCSAIGTDSESEALAAAQSQWRAVMAQWQQIEMYQFGPITDNGSNMRQRIYSWPDSISSCAIDQQVVLAAADDDYDISGQVNQARGLDTLEYLLFNRDLTHTCPSQITTVDNWNSLTETVQKRTRCEFAERVAADVHDNANTLLKSWRADGGNFRQALINSGSEGGAFETQTAAMNALSDALFYADKNTKDEKLGVPLGLHPDCDALTCAQARESIYSNNSLENIKNNLIGFRSVYTTAFEPQLDGKNFPEYGDEIRQYVDDAIAAIDANDSTLASDIAQIEDEGSEATCINAANNPDQALGNFSCTLHGKIKRLTNELKGDFITIISLNLPRRVEGDND